MSWSLARFESILPLCPHNSPLYSLKGTGTHGRAVPNTQHPRTTPFLSHFLQGFMPWVTRNPLCGGDMRRSLGRTWGHQPGVQPWSPQRTLHLWYFQKPKYMICLETLWKSGES